ncbi:alpha/beta fold hydrolase [Streptomyces halobius]|uniref:Alpha/beta hydrolase n=1 Tax=Streptomyces halobius TaxID=2879846 RepID=A0ABY4M3V4_9ACTN|nr:alpha/beta hydrolase [Streptomyces halobius]UQA92424.1 alpha/beta hydrolase [Streptomyces halobius]
MTSRPPRPESARAAAPAPATAVLGEPGAPRHAVVLAPVMPRWDQGAFFRRTAEPLLASGHRITVHDTLSLLREGDDLKALADRWAGHLASAADAPDVLAGNALGGAVVQALLTHEWTHRARVLLLSGPTVADEELNTKLERIASAVGAQGLSTALRLLEEAVRGPATPAHNGTKSPQPPCPDEGLAGRRLSTGLRLLHDADVRQPVRDFPGPLLHLYGQRSLLVQRKHLATGPGPQHHLVGIPQAGMRPHADQPALTRDAVARFLGAEKS